MRRTNNTTLSNQETHRRSSISKLGSKFGKQKVTVPSPPGYCSRAVTIQRGGGQRQTSGDLGHRGSGTRHRRSSASPRQLRHGSGCEDGSRVIKDKSRRKQGPATGDKGWKAGLRRRASGRNRHFANSKLEFAPNSLSSMHHPNPRLEHNANLQVRSRSANLLGFRWAFGKT